MRRAGRFVYPIVLVGGLLNAAFAQSAPSLALKAGAAKVDVTSSESELPKNYEGFLDHIYSRAIVVDNGAGKAAFLTLDARGMPEALWQKVSARAEAELGIPARQLLMIATHSHSIALPPAEILAEKIFQSLKLASEKLQPARIAYGTGVSYLNVNRNIIDPKTRRWWEGPNYDGPMRQDRRRGQIRDQIVAVWSTGAAGYNALKWSLPASSRVSRKMAS